MSPEVVDYFKALAEQTGLPYQKLIDLFRHQPLGLPATESKATDMGEWKVTLTMRLRPALKDGLAEVAHREARSLGNLRELLMEWAFAQLSIAGSTERLRKHNIGANDDVTLKQDHRRRGSTATPGCASISVADANRTGKSACATKPIRKGG